ncbi:hypothetical protein BD408DRAFT_424534 [Parasitella parasitica]|nr:hypothetical protein BD408DRAFT_424534 [Parasitella parasitica]
MGRLPFHFDIPNVFGGDCHKFYYPYATYDSKLVYVFFNAESNGFAIGTLKALCEEKMLENVRVVFEGKVQILYSQRRM